MEQGDPRDSSPAETSPKTRQKKKSLCRILLHKKTRVGCLEVPYGETNRNSKIESSQHGSQTSTKLSLCCAMTERSGTPPQSMATGRSSPTADCPSAKSQIPSGNGHCKHEAAVEKDRGMSPLLRRQYCSECCEKKKDHEHGEESGNAGCAEASKNKRPEKMSTKSSPKKKKKSFLHKFSRAFAGKRRKSESGNESSEEEEGSSYDDRSSSCERATSPRKSKTDVRRMSKSGGQDEGNSSVNLPGKTCDSPSNRANIFEHDNHSSRTNSPVEKYTKMSDERENDGPGIAGSDKNLEAKKLFIAGKIDSGKDREIDPRENRSINVDVEEIREKAGVESTGTKIILGNCDKILQEQTVSSDIPEVKASRDFIKKLKRTETRDVSDSDSEDWTDSDSDELSDDENTDFLDAERNQLELDEYYFTKGKFVSYFFLQMERQAYDPNEVYSIIHFRPVDNKPKRKNKRKVGENSSSGSTSPNLPSDLRRRLLHRRSADNLMANSPTNSMRHSSPESIRSAPIPVKPLRSTSHDTLPKKNKAAGQLDGASMDSLAKQALLAAQVLNLIPTQKARERNYLHGRVAANSLLGPVELEKVLPNREIRIFVGTWNMNGQTPPKELNDFMLPSDIQTVPDMLAIGTQESCSERSEWEAALQETLGPSHVLLTSTGLGTLHLALFIRRDLIWFCSCPEEDNFSTRPGTAFRTKGAIALAVMLFGTSFLFVTAHLTAHQEKVKERVNDIKRIVRNLELPKDLPTRHKSKDVTQNFDCVFWCGDLNFRLAQPREEVIQWISDSSFPRQSPINLHKDQLKTILTEGAVLRGFEEAPITFPPTYKYDPGTQNFDTSSKQRIPAYTDRILFKGKTHQRGYIRRVSHESMNSHKDGIIECLVYDSVPSICTSDHKPVWGVFKTIIRPGIDTIPLAAGLFNREVYLEGIKRRAAAMDDSQNSTSVCSIQ